MSFDYIERGVSWFFKKLGYQIGLRPGYFIIIPILISLIFLTGVQQMWYVTDPEYLFSPVNGPSRVEQKIIEELFPMNLSVNFDVGRIAHIPPAARVIIEAKGNNSVLNEAVYKQILKVDKMIQNVSFVFEERTLRYKDICAKKNGKCFPNDILKLSNRLEAIRTGAHLLKYPLMVNEARFEVLFTAGYLGGVVTDNEGNVLTAKSMNLMYFLPDDTVRMKNMAELWQLEFLNKMTTVAFDNITVGVFTALSVGKELDRTVREVIPFLSATLVAVLCFSVLACTMMDWVRSKILLGVVGCIASGIAVIASFGIVMYCGMEFIAINLGAAFLMLGIGMDDTFVLLAAWHRTNPKDSVPNRMADCFSEAGVAITITSLTNLISFCIGISSPIVAVRVFCTYTATAVLFTYLYQITIFGGFMALYGHAERLRLHALVCVPVMPRSLAKNHYSIYRLLCTGGRNPEDPDNPEDNQEHSMMVFFRDGLGNFLCHTPVKIGVLLLFAVYLAIAVWGLFHINEGLEYKHLVSYNSYAVPYIRLETTYNRLYPIRIPVIINGTLNYADPVVQNQIEDLFQKIESNPYVAPANLTESWLRMYLRFINDKRTSSFVHGLNMSNKEDFLYGLRHVFFRVKFFATYFKQDVVFNENYTEIVGTRYVIQAYNLSSTEAEKNFVNDLRDIVSKAPFQVTLFNPLFLFYDQFILTRSISIQCISIAAVVMIIISLLFIPRISCALWVAFSIISIEVGVIGYMSLWNVHLDPISMIGLIMCIGFSVDFSAHISYAYISCKKTEPDEKLKGALHSVGLPIVQGSISTIITASPLIFAPSYVFIVMVKTVILVIGFGALHGLLLLPILLSLTDTYFQKSAKKESKNMPYPMIPPSEEKSGEVYYLSGWARDTEIQLPRSQEAEKNTGERIQENNTKDEEEKSNFQKSLAGSKEDLVTNDGYPCLRSAANHVNAGFVSDELGKEGTPSRRTSDCSAVIKL